MTDETRSVCTKRDVELLRQALRELPASSAVPMASTQNFTVREAVKWLEAYRGELARIFEENRTIQREAADLRRQRHSVQQFLGIDKLVDRLNEFDYRMHEEGKSE